VHKAAPEVSLYRISNELQKLHMNGTVKPETYFGVFNLLQARIGGDQDIYGVTNQVDPKEHNHHHRTDYKQ
jgi:hypothetical protein